MTKKEFILSDDTLNRNGVIVLTEGIELEEFKENPQMLFNHNTDQPIGIWSSVTKSEGLLLGEAEFDMDDPEAAKIYNKVEKGHLKATSIGLKVLDFDFNEDNIPVITKSRLREASIVPIPANKNAVRLYLDEELVEFNDEAELTLKLNEAFKDKLNNTNKMDKKFQEQIDTLEASVKDMEVTLAEKDELIKANEASIKEKEDLIVTFKAENEALTSKVAEFEKGERLNYIENAVKEGKFNEDQKESLITLSETNFEAVKELAEKAVTKVEPKTNFSEKVAENKEANEKTAKPKAEWNITDYRKYAPAELAEMAENDNEKFLEIIKRK